ncbi:MAG: peptidylprolyl isomerase, partial [Bacteroidota bacterium]
MIQVLPAALAAFILSACNVPGITAPTPTVTQTPTPSYTPTVTPVPLILSVNGEGLTAAEFNAAVARYKKAEEALGKTIDPAEAITTVGQDLTDTLLLGQGAAAEGKTIDDAAVQSRIEALAAQVGGEAALTDWEDAHGYTEADFRADLKRQMAAALMRDQIMKSVPKTAEQVHVRQILLYSAEAAGQALADLKAGTSFDDLAARYAPITSGELGWFPRGYLTETAIETAAFALQVGQYSEVIETETGFHILYLVEREPNHPLSPDALLALQKRVVADWLTQQRNQSTILFNP